MSGSELLEPFERLLGEIVPPARVREIERGGSPAEIWRALMESGFLDALVREESGGAGLTLWDVAPLLQATGRYAVPVPLAETMLARAMLAEANVAPPPGPIVLASPTQVADGYRQRALPLASIAEYALVDTGRQIVLTSLEHTEPTETGLAGSSSADVTWDSVPHGASLQGFPSGSLRTVAAALRACQLAGAADRALELTVRHAGARVQFGKAISAFQAIQQQFAVMAEQVVMARMAAQIGCAHGLPPLASAAATAKHIASAAAITVATTAHAIHGAIGISEEYDLQLYTRRIHEWRLADGSERYWAANLGAQRLASAAGSAEFVRGMYSQAGC